MPAQLKELGGNKDKMLSAGKEQQVMGAEGGSKHVTRQSAHDSNTGIDAGIDVSKNQDQDYPSNM